jgi:cytochrome P450
MFEGRFTNTPHVPRSRAFADSPAMVRNPVAVFETYRKEFGATFSFHWGGAKRSIVSTDPAFIQGVLKEKRDNFPKSDIQVERMVEFQGEGMVNSHGEFWGRQRRLLNPAFTFNRIGELIPMLQSVLDDLLDRFDNEARLGPVDVNRQMVRFTLRMVGKSLFGRNMDESDLDRVGDTIATIQSFIVRQIVQPYLIPWFRISGEARKHQDMRVAADRVVLDYIQARRDEGLGEKDILRHLLEAPYPDTGEPMGEAQALIESIQLLVAGNVTSSNGLTWLFYLLGQHPGQIALIREEIDRVAGDRPLETDHLRNLEYTSSVLYEALRLYPPFWMIDRIAREDDEICGVRIPAGTMVIPYIYGTHRNPAVWDDAESFDPSRFSPEARKARHVFGYLPFGSGPRMCIGSNMAMIQMLLIVATMVRRYDFELASDLPVGLKPMMLLGPDGPVNMRFHARKPTFTPVGTG